MSHYQNPDHPFNGPDYYTGKPCIEPGCGKPAGTAWGPHWCQQHNAERIDRINRNMREISESFTALDK